MSALHDYIVYDALHALQSNLDSCDGFSYGSDRHDDARHDDMLLALVVEQRASLPSKEGATNIHPTNVFYPCQTRGVCVRHDNGFRKRRPVAVDHFGSPPDGYLSLQEVVNAGNSAPANHNICDRDGVIAELTNSIAASGQNTPQVCNQLASGFNRQYYPADDTALSLYVNHADNSDIPVDRLDRDTGCESIGLNNGLRYWTRLVSFPHHGRLS